MDRHPSYLIIGCGHFGSRAAEKLFHKDPRSKIIIVDKSKKALQKVSLPQIEIMFDKGVAYLSQFLLEREKIDYIVPAVPIHLAFEFILLRLKPFGARRVKVPSLPHLPNPVKGRTGDLYTSLAHFLCSEDCPEPARYCTATKKIREEPLYQILKDLKGHFESRVIRSLQLAPGIGGFGPKVLLDLLEDIKRKNYLSRLILISTASRCHGVTSALSL